MDTVNMCCCCLVRPPDRRLKTPYTRGGITEIFANMLEECFQIHLILGDDVDCGICEECVGRLRDANDFKLLVQRSQAEMLTRLERGLHIKDGEPLLKVELSDESDDDFMIQAPSKWEMSDDAVSEGHATPDGVEANSPVEQRPESCGRQLAMACSVSLERHSSPKTPTPQSSDTEATQLDLTSDLCAWAESHDICAEQLTRKSDIDTQLKKHEVKNSSNKTGSIKDRKDANKLSGKSHRIRIRSQLIKRRTGDEPLICNLCKKEFRYKSKFVTHMRNHTGGLNRKYKCDRCPKQFSSKYLLRIHNRIHKGEMPFTCDICKTQFLRKKNLAKHINNHTQTRKSTKKVTYSCANCPEVFMSKFLLAKHMFMHTGDELYSCDICKKQFLSKTSIQTHILNHTEEKQFACDECSSRCRNKYELVKHKVIHTGKKPFSCDICKWQFYFKSSFMAHKRKYEKYGDGKSYNCENCPKIFHSNHELEKHKVIHINVETYVCDVCKRSFTKKRRLQAHIEYFHPIINSKITYSCDKCPKVYPLKRSLAIHSGVHRTEKLFSCDICKKQFRCRQSIIAHLRIHAKEKRFACDECHKKFNSKYGLKMHKNIHTGKKPFSCDICKKQFFYNCTMLAHKRHYAAISDVKSYSCQYCAKVFHLERQLVKHKGIHGRCFDSYICDICNKQIVSKHNLLVHIRIHTEEKKIACEQCPKRFKKIQDLERHKVIHTGMKPFSGMSYSCETCPKVFHSKYQLDKHKVIHISVETPDTYTCDVCKRKFTQKSDLQSHIEYSHPIGNSKITYICDKCPKVFPFKKSLAAHRATHRTENPFSCDVCKKQFAAVSRLMAHKYTYAERNCNNRFNYRCEHCNGAFRTQTLLAKHRVIHTGKRPYACDVCKRRFMFESILTRHMVYYHSTNKTAPYSCDQCPKTCMSEGILAIHKLVHTGKQHFICDICNRKFVYKMSLISHIRAHSAKDKIIYRCKFCSKVCQSQSDLDRHESIHTRKFNCPYCSEVFNVKRDLKIHLRIHKPYICEVCNKDFAYRCNLNTHRHTHLTEKKFSCDICGQLFRAKARLATHMVRVHMKEKLPVKLCDVCGAKFITNYRLKRHKLTHTGDKPFTCEICDKKFARRCGLTEHFRTHTKITKKKKLRKNPKMIG